MSWQADSHVEETAAYLVRQTLETLVLLSRTPTMPVKTNGLTPCPSDVFENNDSLAKENEYQ